MNDAVSQFRDAMRAAGLEPPDVIDPGKFYRFPGVGKRKGNTAGWCKLFDDGLGGCFGDWSSGFSEIWQAKREKPFTPVERDAFMRHVAEAQMQADAERKARQVEAAAKAAVIWDAAAPAPSDHPYIVRKGIATHGARLHNCALLIPMRVGGELHSLQFIRPEGDKRFLTGGRVAGCYFSIGIPEGAAALCIAEGFATGATIHEATGYPVAVAFNTGNLKAVAQAMRARFPTLKLIVCADDDAGTEGNPGLSRAGEAARAVGGLLAVPDFSPDRPPGATDFNDMAAARGMDAVRDAINNAIAPDSGDRGNTPAGDYARDVNLIRASDVIPEPITWLWNGWLAAGKVHILGGAPGTGKTTIALALAATVTSGGRWPDGTRSPVGNVVIWSGEDDPSDTLTPRLALSGADLSRVYFVGDIREGTEQRSFDPACDMEPLRRKLAEIGGVSLLIVDPIVSAVAGDSHKNAEVRRGLQPLADLAISMRCAVLGITHFSKGTGGRDPVERITGSLAFGALARIVLVAAKHQAEGEDGRAVRLFCRAKSNIGPDDGGFEYDLHQSELKTHPGIFASSVLWGDAVEGLARDLLATAETVADEGCESVPSATSWLRELLDEEGGRIDRRDVMKAANAMGFKERTVHRAREKLGLAVQQTGFGKDKRSMWAWPATTMPASIVPIMPDKNAGTHGMNGDTHEGTSWVEVEI